MSEKNVKLLLLFAFLFTASFLWWEIENINKINYLGDENWQNRLKTVKIKEVKEDNVILRRKTLRTKLVSIKDLFIPKKKKEIKKKSKPKTDKKEKKAKGIVSSMPVKKKVEAPVLFPVAYMEKGKEKYFYVKDDKGKLFKLKVGDKVKKFKVIFLDKEKVILKYKDEELKISFQK